MVKHLWHEHGLRLERGKARSSTNALELLKERHATTGAQEPLDQFASQTGVPGLRRWLAGEELPFEELALLLAEAGDRGAGLCPVCFLELRAAVEPLPEPLTFTRGRLAGEGIAIEVGGNAWFRTLRVNAAGSTSIGRRSLAPRAVGTLAALVVLGVAMTLVQGLPGALAGVATAVLTYALARALCSTSRGLVDRAVDAAWSRVASKLAERPNAARFLARLCLASFDRGEPETRAWILNAINRRASRKAEESDEELQLLASARVLQVDDMRRYGRDVTAGIAALAADGLTSALSADYAEFVVGSYLSHPREPRELGRLRVLLLGAAFEAGLAPRDLLHLWAGAPNLKRAMMVEPTHRLGLLYGLWRTREAKSWESVAPAITVFDLARTSPPTAERILAHFPDLMLYHRAAPEIEGLVGPVLICARGVSIEGHFVADPDADLRLANDGRRLIFGQHRIDAARRLPAELPALLRRWLRFRADVLVPFIEESLAAGSQEVANRVLGPFCRRCLACGAISAVSAGSIGQQVQA
jgi:hypothetical protein